MNLKKHKLVVLMFALFALIFAMSINSSAASINKKKATIYVGKTISLKVKGAKTAPVWKSSDEEVATVTKKGKVQGLKKGTAVISAVVGKKTYKCKVTVKSNITLSTYKLKLKKPTTVTITMKESTSIMYTLSNKKICKCSWTNEWDYKLTKTKLKITPKQPGKATVTICGTKNRLDTAVIEIICP